MNGISMKATFPMFLATGPLFGVFLVFSFVILMQFREIADYTDLAFVSYLTSYTFVIGVVAMYIILTFIWSLLVITSFKYSVEEAEFRTESGVLSKKYSSIAYDRIQNVDIKRSLSERLFGLSTIGIQTSGSGHYEVLLPGLTFTEAETMRSELMSRAKTNG